MPNTVLVSKQPRYDLFYKASLLEAVGDIKKAYQEFAKIIRANFPECQARNTIYIHTYIHTHIYIYTYTLSLACPYFCLYARLCL